MQQNLTKRVEETAMEKEFFTYGDTKEALISEERVVIVRRRFLHVKREARNRGRSAALQAENFRVEELNEDGLSSPLYQGRQGWTSLPKPNDTLCLELLGPTLDHNSSCSERSLSSHKPNVLFLF